MRATYALIPDGDQQPAALFAELEDAIDWGVQRYGADAFVIRYVEVIAVARSVNRPS